MPRKQKKYHFIYKTVNILTGKYYIGMHSTDDLKDGYCGSGKYLWNSIHKYGKEAHTIEILEFALDRKALSNREQELVNEDLLNDSLCMNLRIGGGGFGSSKSASEAAIKSNLGKQKFTREKLHNDLEKLRLFRERARQTGPMAMRGKKHSVKTKAQMSVSHSGTNNSQFGTMWINNGIDNKKIKRDEMIPCGYIKGRKWNRDY